MNIDDKIKQELETEAKQLDTILAHEPGLFSMLGQTFKGALGGWVILVMIVTFAVSIAMFWSGYQFFFVEHTLEQSVKWGIGLLLSTMVQIAFKMWTFMEMNRQSGIRELKRIELSIERLSKQLR